MIRGGVYERVYRAVVERMESFTSAVVSWDDFNLEDKGTIDNKIWVRPSINEAASQDASFISSSGSSVKRHDFILTFQFFAPLGSGIFELLRIVDEVAGLFRDYDTNQIWFNEPQTRIVGIDPIRKTWYHINLDISIIFLDTVPSRYQGLERLVIEQSGHGFSVGNAVYSQGSNSWAKAQADDIATVAHGVVINVAGDQFTVATNGFINFSHGLGSSGNAYLSTATAGSLTTSTASAGVHQFIGRVVDSSNIVLSLSEGSTI